MPVLLAALGPLLAQVMRYVFMAHLAGFLIRLLTVFGVSLATNEYIVEPIMDLIHGNAQGVPADLAMWLSAFGIDRVISIMVTAYGIVELKRVFVTKSS